MADLYLGIDVGTGSARAGLFTSTGELVGSATRPTRMWRIANDHNIYEQSTEDIWSAIGECIREALAQANADKSDVKGIGIDATCSLAVTDSQGVPIAVTPGECGKPGERNVILWADHRANEEANLINQTGSIVLDYLGGSMSLEMEIPKILWLKKHMPAHFFQNCHFFDLPDYLTFRATDSSQRSACSLVCKCSYIPQSGWQPEFFSKIGLSDLVETHYRQLSTNEVLTAGSPVGTGLSRVAAVELGLEEGTPVGSAVIDAYAGWIGTIAARHVIPGEGPSGMPDFASSSSRLAIVAGTSSCHLVQSPNPTFVPGVWGPYRDTVFPAWWMNEGGQSATGQLIDFILTTHPAYPEAKQIASSQKLDVHEWLGLELESQIVTARATSYSELTKHIHIYPDFHGNRSPIGDAGLRGSIIGVDFDISVADLARKYYATLESIAFQTKQIISQMNENGHNISQIHMSGGLSQNLLLMQLVANVCQMNVILPHSATGTVLLGAAILGRYSYTLKSTPGSDATRLWDIMVNMTPTGTLLAPSAGAPLQKLLQVKYRIFLDSLDIQRQWRQRIQSSLAT